MKKETWKKLKDKFPSLKKYRHNKNMLLGVTSKTNYTVQTASRHGTKQECKHIFQADYDFPSKVALHPDEYAIAKDDMLDAFKEHLPDNFSYAFVETGRGLHFTCFNPISPGVIDYIYGSNADLICRKFISYWFQDDKTTLRVSPKRPNEHFKASLFINLNKCAMPISIGHAYLYSVLAGDYPTMPLNNDSPKDYGIEFVVYYRAKKEKVP